MPQKARLKKRPTNAAPPPKPSALKNIVWLASYPKSGNTWARMFLANYLLATLEPIPINQVHRIGIGDSVANAYRIVAGGRYDPMDTMGHLRLREKVLRGIVNNGADMNFVKTHNARDRAFGVELIVPRYTRAAVYILRNPLDVAVSYARHYGQTPAQAARSISRPDNTTSADATSVKQYLGNWSEHVTGWAEGGDFPVHVMRYEDMKADAQDAFAGLLRFLGIPVDAERLERAVRFSSFDEMKRQESATPFIERSASLDRFFHTGETGQWKAALSPEDVAFLRERHGKVMSKYGYL
jgi:Sulfotransferase domain